MEEVFDRRASSYDQSEMHVALARAVASFVDLAGVNDLLDVATGTGLVLRALSSGRRLVGTDVSQGMLDEAQKRLPNAAFIRADAAALPFDESSFDLVTCVAALPYVDVPASLAEWVRVLRTDGRIVVTAFRPDGLTGLMLLRTAAAAHGVLMDDPNAEFGTVTALGRAGEVIGLEVSRATDWAFPADRPSAEQLMAKRTPGRPSELADLGDSTREQIASRLAELIDATPTFEYRAVLVEFALR